jgi:hypothetical protein
VGHLQADILQVMDASATDRNYVLAGVHRYEFVCRHREAQTAPSESAAQTSNYTVSVRAGQTNYYGSSIRLI